MQFFYFSRQYILGRILLRRNVQLIDEKIRKLLDTYDWKSLITILSDYALVKVRKGYWHGGRVDLPMGNQIEDLVVGAIMKVYSGDRKWHPEKDPELVDYLKSIIDSDVNHLIYSYDHRFRQHEAVGIADSDHNNETIPYEKADRSQDPLSQVIADEQWDCLWKSAAGDEDMQMVLLCSEEHCIDRSAISEKLKWKLDRVDIILRKIRRHMSKCIERKC